MLRIERFAKAVIEHVKDGCASVSSEQLAERLRVCEGCPLRHGLRCSHSDCGCFLWLKAKWRSEDCPAGKWSKP